MANSATATTIILIRHGERIEPTLTNNDPHLTTAGLSRARLLVHVLGQANIKAIYTSEYIRTIETAKPLATHLGLTPMKKTLAVDIKNKILANNIGKTVLVVGHSDTVPGVINLLGGSNQVIADHEFDNMFVATILGVGKLAVTRLKYGVRS